MDAAFSGPVGFCVGPATFPGWSWFSVSGLFAFVLRLGYIDPAESFAFPLLACTSPTSKHPVSVATRSFLRDEIGQTRSVATASLDILL